MHNFLKHAFIFIFIFNFENKKKQGGNSLTIIEKDFI